MKKNGKSLEAVKKKQMDVGEKVSEVQKKGKEIQDNKRKIDNLHEIVSDTSLDEEYRKACASEVGKVQTEYYKQKDDLNYDMINLKSEINETKEEVQDNINKIEKSKEEVGKVDGKTDNRSSIEKLKTKLKEIANGSLKE